MRFCTKMSDDRRCVGARVRSRAWEADHFRACSLFTSVICFLNFVFTLNSIVVFSYDEETSLMQIDTIVPYNNSVGVFLLQSWLFGLAFRLCCEMLFSFEMNCSSTARSAVAMKYASSIRQKNKAMHPYVPTRIPLTILSQLAPALLRPWMVFRQDGNAILI